MEQTCEQCIHFGACAQWYAKEKMLQYGVHRSCKHKEFIDEKEIEKQAENAEYERISTVNPYCI